MNQKELKEIIELVYKRQIAEFEIEQGDFKLRIKTSSTFSTGQFIQEIPHMVSDLRVTSPHQVSVSQEKIEIEAPPLLEDKTPPLYVVKAPIVGTFYSASSPTADPFVEIGKKTKVGTVLCIIEAMKLMNEIESDVSGTIMEIYHENGSPVEYGQPLFGILLD